MVDSYPALIDYLRITLGGLVRERFCVLYLNSRLRVISQSDTDGTINEAPAYVREVIHRALDLGSSYVVLAHNHPSGDPAPSRADITVSKQIRDAALPLGISLLDHVIVATAGEVSLRARGLI